MKYHDYLQTQEWKAKARACKERYSWRCALCNSSDALDAHHRTYARLGHERPTDLVALCRSCHENFHDIGREQEASYPDSTEHGEPSYPDSTEHGEPSYSDSTDGVLALSDTWVVEKLASWLKNEILYVPETGHFHLWSTGG